MSKIMRRRHRYLAIRIDSEHYFEERELSSAFWRTATELFGEYGSSKMGFFLIKYDEQRKLAVIRCSLKAIEMVRTSIALITKINDKPTALHVSRISGTLRGLLEKCC
jgi:RNase P/RNase MRP subunit POP5